MSFAAQSAKNPNAEGMQYHIRLKKGDIPPAVLIPGDPNRVQKIAALWDSAEEVENYRQYHSMKGMFGKVPIAAVSSGIGSPGLAIALEELARIDTKTVIRVGTCGSLQPDMQLGDLVISTGAVRLDGASKDYVRPEFPAVADYRVVAALVKAAEKLKLRHHVGITASTDTFYCGQGRPGYNNYLPSFQEHIFDDMQKAGVKNFEMEAGCLFTLSSLFGLMSGCICVVIADRVKDQFGITDEVEMLPAKVANEAIKILMEKE
jgi:uridine phosphorylase